MPTADPRTRKSPIYARIGARRRVLVPHIPDFWRKVSCVSAAYGQHIQETHETGSIRVHASVLGNSKAHVALYARSRAT